MDTAFYGIAQLGLGTEFSESDQPSSYARKLTNRFINLRGAAEKRPGMRRIGATAAFGFPVDITGIHEHVSKDGTSALYISGSALGTVNIHRYNSLTQTWDFSYSGSGEDGITGYESVQMGNKLIFVNGVDRNVYFDENDYVDELKAIVETGTLTTGVTASSVLVLRDSSISDWTTQTYVKVNDIFYDAALNSYGVITSVGASNLDCTIIGTAGNGLGNVAFLAPAGAQRQPQSGDAYEIYDSVALNIIKQGGLDLYDNTAIGGSGTTTSAIAVAGTNFATTEIRVGDWVYNTTRAALTKVESVSANISVYDVSGQIAGDSLVFLKSAMPIASFAHVHFNRLYMIDARDPTKVRISGPDDPTDMTTFAQTIQSVSIDFGSQQPKGDNLLALGTYQKFLVAGGKQNVYFYEGTDPIEDTSAAVVNFSPVAVTPHGILSSNSLSAIGNDIAFASQDGLRQFRLSDILAFETSNASEVIKSELRAAIRSNRDTPEKIVVTHYPRRNWLLVKVGDVIYNYNYTPVFDDAGNISAGGSWSKFTGKFAECNAFFIRSNGDLLCADSNGKVYIFDDGDTSDDGEVISTEYQFQWPTLEEPNRSVDVKDVRYIKTFFETTTETVYNVSAEAAIGLLQAQDSVNVTASGGPVIGSGWTVGSSPVGGIKTVSEVLSPLRLRGGQFKLNIKTSGGLGTDVISKFALMGNRFGRDT